jgi:hypothetical protein
VRTAVPHLEEDRIVSNDFAAAVELVRSGTVLQAVVDALSHETPPGPAAP